MATQEEIEKQKELNRLKQEQLDLDNNSNESLEYASIAFKNIVDEIRGGNDQLKIADQLQKSRVSSLTKSSNLARQLLEVAKGESTLSKKQLQSIRLKTEAEKANLERILEERKGLTKVIDGHSVIGKQIKQEIADLEEVLDKQDQIEGTIKATNKALGFAPALAGGFDKALQKAGFPALGISQAIEDTQKDAQKGAKGFNAMGTFAGKVASNLKESASSTNITQLAIGVVVDKMLEINKLQTEFRQLTGESANNITALNTALISTSDQLQTMVALTDTFGFNANVAFDAINIQEATELRELMGLSAEEAGNLAFFAQASGTNLKEAAANIYDGVSAGLSQKKILQDVGKVSNSIAMTFGGNLELMGKTASEARKLGLSLQQLDNIASGLLDIESSIAAEFEAEVISGKQLNLEQARYFALTNNIEGLTKEIGKNQAVIDSFATGNRIEQEATAAAIGISREEMSKMVFDQAIANKMSIEDAATRSGMSIEDAKRLGIQDSLNKSIEKMAELLAGPAELMANILSNSIVLQGIMTAIGVVTTVSFAKSLGGAFVSLAAMIPKTAVLLGLQVGKAAAAIAEMSALTLGLGTVGILAATALGVAGIKSMVGDAQNVKDGIAPPSKGPFTITDSFGATAITAKGDGLAVSPNISRENMGSGLASTAINPPLPPPSISIAPNIIREENRNNNPTIDYDQLADAIAMGAEKGTSRANITTNLDGSKVSNRIQAPLAMNTRKYSV